MHPAVVIPSELALLMFSAVLLRQLVWYLADRSARYLKLVRLHLPYSRCMH